MSSKMPGRRCGPNAEKNGPMYERRILRLYRAAALALLAISLAAWVPLAAAQSASGSATPSQEELRRLQELSPEERLELLEAMRAAESAQAEEDRDDSTPGKVVDDRFAPRPIGGQPLMYDDADSLALESPDGGLLPVGIESELERFGRGLFDLAPETFQPLSYGPVPDDYRLGPGDEVVLEVWGEVSLRNAYQVDRRGNVLLRDAGQVSLAGLTLQDAQAEVTRRLSRVLSGVRADGTGSTYVALSLGRLRSIRVFVIGEARRPGGYEVSSVATVFQALYAAGGPNDIGSMRNIRLIRDNREESELDLYAYLMQGKTRRGSDPARWGHGVSFPWPTRW